MTDQEEEIKTDTEKDHSQLAIGVGLVGTFIWIVFLITLFVQTDLPKNWSLNHLGDFLAGAFAPLAVFWFVLGFFLQIKEIRYQRIEINRLGGFTERQAHAAEKRNILDEKELEKGKAGIRPRLLFLHPGTSSDRKGAMVTLNFKNVGGTAYDFKIRTTAANLLDVVAPKIAVEQNGTSFIRFVISTTEHLPQPIELTYLDLDRNEYIHKGLVSNDSEINKLFFDNQKLLTKKQE